MTMEKAKKWIITTAGACVGGGIAGAFTAAMDPSKYHFPQDFGSGKLWKYFGMGVALTFGGMLLHSPLGQKVMGSYKATQEQLAQDQRDLDQAKKDLKAAPKEKE
jgi:hypothetical protein